MKNFGYGVRKIRRMSDKSKKYCQLGSRNVETVITREKIEKSLRRIEMKRLNILVINKIYLAQKGELSINVVTIL